MPKLPRYIVAAILLCLMYCAGSQAAFAQNYVLDKPQRGVIYMAAGDTLESSFSINLPNDILQVNAGKLIKTYSSRQVKWFKFYDEENQITRFFYSLPYNERGHYKVPVFFEMIFGGDHLSILARESIVIETAPNYDPFYNRTVGGQRARLVVDYYMMNAKGAIKPYRLRKKEVLKFLSDEEMKLKEFIKSERIDFASKADLFKVAEYYNQLKKQP
jgi:hypothetical protein